MAVRVDLNISLDGFATTTDQTRENPFGHDCDNRSHKRAEGPGFGTFRSGGSGPSSMG